MQQRIITGTIIGLISLFCIIYLPNFYFNLALSVIILIGAYEWSNLLKMSFIKKVVWLGFITVLLYASLYFFSKELRFYFLITVSLLWLTIPFILWQHNKKPVAVLTNPFSLLLIATVTLLSVFNALVLLRQIHYIWLLLLIILIAGADSFAYFVGRKIGKRKLAVNISPGKSIEGAYAALVTTLIMSVIAFFFIQHYLKLSSNIFNLGIVFIVACVLIAIISICGDLLESLVKRHAGVKDSGNILPGHGGILDRIDALTAASPLFYCVVLLLFIAK